MQAGDDTPRTGRTTPWLTTAELRLLGAIEDMIAEHGYAPTVRELAARIGWKSAGSTHQYLERLRALGVIAGSGRSLRVRRPTPSPPDERRS